MKKRNTGFDLLKSLAMLGIVLFHHFGCRTPNHFVQLSEGFTKDSYFYDFINNIPGTVDKLSIIMDFCYGHFGNGGNLIFMTITGYFLFGREIPISKRVRIAGKVLFAIVFHGVVITLINYVVLLMMRFNPNSTFSTYHPLFTLPNWISGENVWYLQAYGVFILVVLPIIKRFENSLTRKIHLCLVLTIVFLRFFAISTYLPNLWISNRIIDFIMCYFLGGYLSKYSVSIGWKKLIVLSISYVVSYCLYEYYWRFSCATIYKPSEYSFVKVVQPFLCCILFSMLSILIFINVTIPSKNVSKCLKRIASSTIGIYIFHYNVIPISFAFANYFWWHDWSRRGYFIFSVIDSLLLFLTGFLIDSVRIKLYQRIEPNMLSLLITND